VASVIETAYVGVIEAILFFCGDNFFQKPTQYISKNQTSIAYGGDGGSRTLVLRLLQVLLRAQLGVNYQHHRYT